MKKAILGLMIIFLIINAEDNIAQDSADGIIKDVLTKLLTYSKNKSYEKAASLIAYSGEDKNRELISPFDPANKEELNQVKRVCKKISAILDLSSKYELGEIEKSNESGKEVATVKVDFVSGDQKLTTVFRFIKTDTGFLIIK